MESERLIQIYDLSQESEEETNIDPIYKELKFEPDSHTHNTINKCAEFWHYIYSRPDIEPVHSNLCSSYSRHKLKKIRDSYEKFKTNKSKKWLITLLKLHDLGCDKMAIDATRQCKICVQQQHLEQQEVNDENVKSIKRQIENLSKWEPDPAKLTKNVY